RVVCADGAAIARLGVTVRVDAEEPFPGSVIVLGIFRWAGGEQLTSRAAGVDATAGFGGPVPAARYNGDRQRYAVDVADVVRRSKVVVAVEVELGQAGGLFTLDTPVRVHAAVANEAME